MDIDFNIGDKVNILRSNGKIQEATIQKLNDDETVIVEWTEGLESKGKEVTIDQLIEINYKKLNKKLKIKPRQTIVVKDPACAVKQRLLNSNSDNKAKITEIPILEFEENNRKDENKPINNLKAESIKRKMSIFDDRLIKRTKSLSESGQQFLNANTEFKEMIENYRNDIKFSNKYPNKVVKDRRITVCVRKRPLNIKEKTKSDIDIITISDPTTILVHECKSKVDLSKYLENHKFQFDHVFNEDVSNIYVYKKIASPLIDCLFEGGRSTCFAYGQTGSGKTYTMNGDPVVIDSKGIYDYSVNDVFDRLKNKKNICAYVSLFEIYVGKIYDLLNKKKSLRMLEDSNGQVQVIDLVEIPVTDAKEALTVIKNGLLLRSAGKTSANIYSSRSHSIFQVILKKKGVGRNQKYTIFGSFAIIDLAGNERGVDTSKCDRQTRLEGSEINKSLLALKECIRALRRKGSHLPFRGSKLTQILRDSFMSEKFRTCMIATISPGLSCCENTLNTLRYTDQVKDIASDKHCEVNTCDNDDIVEKFHQTVDNIFNSQEELYHHHRNLVTNYSQWQSDENNLLCSFENGNHNIDDYVSKLEAIVESRVTSFNQLKAKMDYIKTLLFEEEQASKLVKNLPTV